MVAFFIETGDREDGVHSQPLEDARRGGIGDVEHDLARVLGSGIDLRAIGHLLLVMPLFEHIGVVGEVI